MPNDEVITAEGFKVGKNWLNFINFIQQACPDGDVKVKFAAGSPVKLIDAKPDVRFDKGPTPVTLVKL